MAKKLGLISPTNLWGKPLKSAAPQKTADEKVKGQMTYDDDVTDDDEIDVDAELADADAEESELEVIEAETDSVVTDDEELGDPDEEEAEDDEPDYDAEDGDVADQSETITEDDEEVVTAVADDSEEDGDDEIPATTGKGSMSAEKMSLSDHVRAEIARRQKSGDSLRGKDIVEALGKRKLKVSPAQVSQLLKKAGLGGQPRGKKAEKPAAAPAGDKSRMAGKSGKKGVEPAAKPQPPVKIAGKAKPAANGFRVPMEQLQAAEAFVGACGGSFKDAERILTAAAQLSQTFGG